MTGIENIISRIESDAEKTAGEIIARAQHEAEEIRAGFATSAKEEAAAVLEKGKKLADERVLRLGGVAALEARKMNLRTKQQMIDLAFNQALASLRELDGDAYVDVLSDLAVASSVSGNEEIILSEADREKYGKEVVSLANKKLSDDGENFAKKAISVAGRILRGEGLRLSDETRPINGGIILKEDTLEVDASFETIVRLMRDDLAGDVANILFS